jgi:hypothetical protein
MHDDLIALLRRGWRFGLSADGDLTRAVGAWDDSRIIRKSSMPIEALAQVVEAAKVLEKTA